MESLEARTLMANAGALDPTFGSGGIAFTPVMIPGTTFSPTSIAPVSPSVMGTVVGGRLVTNSGTGISATSTDVYAVEDLRGDGTPDPTFGQGGVASVTLPTGDFIPGAVAIQSNPIALTNNGRIDLVGTVDDASSQPMILVAQFDADGMPDPSFGTQGVALIDPAGFAPGFQVKDAVIQGNQVVLGGDYPLAPGPVAASKLALVRLTPGGQLDPSFGTGGAITFSASQDPEALKVPLDTLTALKETADGGLVVLAQAAENPAAQDVVFRFLSSGAVDTTLDPRGYIFLDDATVGQFTSLAVQPDGKIVLAGFGPKLPDGSSGPSVVDRLNADGTPDASYSFDASGLAFTEQSLALQADGDIILAGEASGPSLAANEYAVVRLLPDLTADPSFGVDPGVATFGSPDINGGVLSSLGIDANGNYVVSGTLGVSLVGNVTGGSFFARILATPLPTPPPPASADLAIAETASSPTPSVGAISTVTLTVTNLGPSDASNVLVTDTLPPGATFDGVVSSQGGAAVGGEPEDFLGTIAAHGSATVTFSFAPAIAGMATNTIQVAGDQSDPDPTNNSVTQALDVAPAPDLAVAGTKTGDGIIGDIQLFSLVVTNNGQVPAIGVTLLDALPADSAIVRVAPTQGSVTSLANGLATVALGSIAPGASATVVVVYVPQVPGVFLNAASASGNQPDPDPANNLALLGASIQESVDLAVSQTLEGDGNTGDLQIFHVTVTNQSQFAATNVILTDALPVNATIAQVAPTQGDVTQIVNGLATIDLGTIGAGAVVSVTVGYIPRGPGVFFNLAAVGGDQPDPVPANNVSYGALVALDGPIVTGVARPANYPSIIVSFNEPLALFGAETLASYRFYDLGTSSNPLDQIATPVPLIAAIRTPNDLSVLLTPRQLLPNHYYLLVIDGTSALAVIDLSGRRLDGTYSGRPGSDYSVKFRYEDLPVFPS